MSSVVERIRLLSEDINVSILDFYEPESASDSFVWGRDTEPNPSDFVWWRRKPDFRQLMRGSQVDNDEQDKGAYLRQKTSTHRQKEWNYASRYVSEFLPPQRQLDPIGVASRASLNPLQLSVAKQCGFHIPQYWFGNDSGDLHRFVKETDANQYVMKILEIAPPGHEHHASIKFPLDRNDVLKTTLNVEPSSVPLHIQTYVPKLCEWRIIMINNERIDVNVNSQASDGSHNFDWRANQSDGSLFTKSALPKDIGEKLNDFASRMSMRTGVFDLIETPENEFVFLEVNPVGQWQFHSEDITESIIDMFAKNIVSMTLEVT